MLLKMSSRVFTNVWCLLITILHGDDDVPSVSVMFIEQLVASYLSLCSLVYGTFPVEVFLTN